MGKSERKVENQELIEFNRQKAKYTIVINKMMEHSNALNRAQYDELVNHLKYLKNLCLEYDTQTKQDIEQYLQNLSPYQSKLSETYTNNEAQVAFAIIATGASLAQGNYNRTFLEKLESDRNLKAFYKLHEKEIKILQKSIKEKERHFKSHEKQYFEHEKAKIMNLSIFDVDKLEAFSSLEMVNSKKYYVSSEKEGKVVKPEIIEGYRRKEIPDANYANELRYLTLEEFIQYKTTEARLFFVKKMLETMKNRVDKKDFLTFSAFLSALKEINTQFPIEERMKEMPKSDSLPDLELFKRYKNLQYIYNLEIHGLEDLDNYIPAPQAVIDDGDRAVEAYKSATALGILYENDDLVQRYITVRGHHESDGYLYDDIEKLYHDDLTRRFDPNALKHHYVISNDDIEKAKHSYEAKIEEKTKAAEAEEEEEPSEASPPEPEEEKEGEEEEEIKFPLPEPPPIPDLKSAPESKQVLSSISTPFLEPIKRELFRNTKYIEHAQIKQFSNWKPKEDPAEILARISLLKAYNFSHVLEDGDGHKVYLQYHKAKANYDTMNPINPYEAEIQALQYLQGMLIIADHDVTINKDDINKIYDEFQHHVGEGRVGVDHTRWLAEQLAQLLSIRLDVPIEKARKQITMARDMAVMATEHPSVCTVSEIDEGQKVSVEFARNGHVSKNYYDSHFSDAWLNGAEKFAGLEENKSNWLRNAFDKDGDLFKKFKEYGVPAPPSARWLELPANWQHLKHFQAEAIDGELHNKRSSDFIRLGTLSAYDIGKAEERIAIDQLKEIIKDELIQKIEDYKRDYKGFESSTFFVDYINILSPVVSDTKTYGKKLVGKDNNNDFILLAKEAMKQVQGEIQHKYEGIEILFNHTNSAINHLADRSKDEGAFTKKRATGIGSGGVIEFIEEKAIIQKKLDAVKQLIYCIEKDIKDDDYEKIKTLASSIEKGDKIEETLAEKSFDTRHDIANRLRAYVQLKLLMKGSEPYASMKNSERNLMKASLELLTQGKQAIKIVGCKSARDRTAILMASVKTMQEDPHAMSDINKLNSGIIRGLKQGHHFRAMCYHVAIAKVNDVRRYYLESLPRFKEEIISLNAFVKTLKDPGSRFKPSAKIVEAKKEKPSNEFIIQKLSHSDNPADRRLSQLVAIHADKLKANDITTLTRYIKGKKDADKGIDELTTKLRTYSNELALQQITELKEAIENVYNRPIIGLLRKQLRAFKQSMDVVVTDAKYLEKIKELATKAEGLNYPSIQEEETEKHRKLLSRLEHRQALLEKQPVRTPIQLGNEDSLKKSYDLLKPTLVVKKIDPQFKKDITDQLEYLSEVFEKYKSDALFYKAIQDKYKSQGVFIEEMLLQCDSMLKEIDERIPSEGTEELKLNISRARLAMSDESKPIQQPKALKTPTSLDKRKAKAELDIELAMIELRQAMIESRAAKNTAQIQPDVINANKYLKTETKEKYNELYQVYNARKIDNFDVKKLSGLIGDYQVVRAYKNTDNKVIRSEVENSTQSEERVHKVLGEAGYKALHEGGSPVESTEARKLFLHKLQSALDARSKQGNHTKTITMTELLGEDGIKLYKAALKEESESKAFRNAVFLKCLKTTVGPKWLKRLVLWVGGPSSSGKTFATDAMIAKIEKDVMSPKSKDEKVNAENHVVIVDGMVEREVSQVRHLTLQVGLELGYTGVDDLEDYYKKASKSKLKEKVQNAAEANTKLSMAIVDTFTKSFSESDEERKKMFEKYNGKNDLQIFSQVTSDPEAKNTFQESVRRMGVSRAFLKKGTVYSGISINNYLIGCESKKYNPGLFKSNFYMGSKQSNRNKLLHQASVRKIEREIELADFKAPLKHREAMRQLTAHSFEIINDLVYIIFDEKTNEWRPCTEKDEGQIIMTTQRAFKAWKESYECYESKHIGTRDVDEEYDRLSEWLASKGDEPEYKDAIIKHFENGEPVAEEKVNEEAIVKKFIDEHKEKKHEELSEVLSDFTKTNTMLKSTLMDTYDSRQDKKSLIAILNDLEKKAKEFIAHKNPGFDASNYTLISWKENDGYVQYSMINKKPIVGGEGYIHFGYKIDETGNKEETEMVVKFFKHVHEKSDHDQIYDLNNEINANKELYENTSDKVFIDSRDENGQPVHGRAAYLMEKLPGFDFAKKDEKGLNFEKFVEFKFSFEERCEILRDIFDQLKKLHDAGYYHGDINPTNIKIYRENGIAHAKLFDFGLAKKLSKKDDVIKLNIASGMAEFIAPETVAELQYSQASDLYGMGAIVGMMFTVEPTKFINDKLEEGNKKEKDEKIDIMAISQKHYNNKEMLVGFNDVDSVSKDKLTDFVSQMTNENPKERPNSQKAFEFFKDLVEQKVKAEEEKHAEPEPISVPPIEPVLVVEAKEELKPEAKEEKKPDAKAIKEELSTAFKTAHAIEDDATYELCSWTDSKGNEQYAMVKEKPIVGGEGVIRLGYESDAKGENKGAEIVIKSVIRKEEMDEYITKVANEIAATQVLYPSTSDRIIFPDASSGYVMEKLPGYDFVKGWENKYNSVLIRKQETPPNESEMKADQIILSKDNIYWLEDGKRKVYDFNMDDEKYKSIKSYYEKYTVDKEKELPYASDLDARDLIPRLVQLSHCRQGEGFNCNQFMSSWLTFRDRCQIMHDIFDQLKKLHDAGYAHSDINPTNIKIYRDEKDEWHAKLFDFGQAIKLDPENKKGFLEIKDIKGMIGFIAPEAMGKDKKYGKKSDLYSMGAIVGMLFSDNPNEFIKGKLSESDRLAKEKIRDNEVIAQQVLAAPYSYDTITSDTVSHFAKKMTDQDPAKRPSNDEALNFFANLMHEHALVSDFKPDRLNVINIDYVKKYIANNEGLNNHAGIRELLKTYNRQNIAEEKAFQKYEREKNKIYKKLKKPKDTHGKRLLALIKDIAKVDPSILPHFKNTYIYIGEKSGGANKPGPHGGRYRKVEDGSMYLFKQDTSYKFLKTIPIDPEHHVEKDISEFVATRMSSGVYTGSSPGMEVKRHPAQDSPYIGSKFEGQKEGERYEDLYKDIYKRYYRLPELKALRAEISEGKDSKESYEKYTEGKDEAPKYVDPDYFKLIDKLNGMPKEKALAVLDERIKSLKKKVKNRPMCLGTKQQLGLKEGEIFKHAIERKKDDKLIYQGIEKCLVLSALFADNDVHSGNIGVVIKTENGVESRRCVRIDFGAALAQDYFNTKRALKLGSRQLSKFLIAAPTNHFTEYPKTIRYTDQFAKEIHDGIERLEHRMEHELKLFDSPEFSLWPREDRIKFAKYIGMQGPLPNDDKELNATIKKHVETVLQHRMSLLKKYELEIRLSSCFKMEKRTFGFAKFVLDPKKQEQFKKLILDNKEKFEHGAGKYKARSALFTSRTPQAREAKALFKKQINAVIAEEKKREENRSAVELRALPPKKVEEPKEEYKERPAEVKVEAAAPAPEAEAVEVPAPEVKPAEEKADIAAIAEPAMVEAAAEKLTEKAAAEKAAAEKAAEEKAAAEKLTADKLAAEKLAAEKAAAEKAAAEKAAAEKAAAEKAEAERLAAAEKAERKEEKAERKEEKEEKDEKPEVRKVPEKLIGKEYGEGKHHEAIPASSAYYPDMKWEGRPKGFEHETEILVEHRKMLGHGKIRNYEASFTKKLEADNSVSIICNKQPKPPYLENGMPTWQCLQYAKDQIREMLDAFEPQKPIIEVKDRNLAEAYVLICKANGITCLDKSGKNLNSFYGEGQKYALRDKLKIEDKKHVSPSALRGLFARRSVPDIVEPSPAKLDRPSSVDITIHRVSQNVELIFQDEKFGRSPTAMQSLKIAEKQLELLQGDKSVTEDQRERMNLILKSISDFREDAAHKPRSGGSISRGRIV